MNNTCDVCRKEHIVTMTLCVECRHMLVTEIDRMRIQLEDLKRKLQEVVDAL